MKTFNLGTEQNSAIREARSQFEIGEYLINEQANEEIEAWLKLFN